MARTDRPGTWFPAVALVALLLFDAIRVWLPSLLFAAELTAIGQAATALIIAAVPALLAVSLPRRTLRVGWLTAVALLIVTRLLLQVELGGDTPLALASAMVITAALAIGIATRMTQAPGGTRFSVIVGLAASATIHAGLGMTDLAWRTGGFAWVTTLLLLAATAVTARDTTADPTDPEPAGARWPWWLFGPILLLLGVLAFVPGRVATAVRWSDPLVAATIVAAAGLLILAVLLGRWLGAAVAGPLGAALTLVGTAGALETTGWIAVASQLGLAAGLGSVVAATDRVQGTARPHRVAMAAASFPLLFTALVLAYYLDYQLLLPYPNRLVLLGTSLLIAIGGLWSGASHDREVVRERGVLRRLAGGVAVTAALALVAALLVGDGERGPAQPGAPGETIRVALVNLHLGFTPEGDLAVHRLGERLAAQDPDIVVVNEVDRGWLMTGGRDTLRQLSSHLGLSYVFGPAADEVWGNAVLSRYPVAESAVDRLPRGRDPMVRSQLIAVLEVAPEQQIAVIGTQLSEIDQQGDTRLPQARAIAATVVRLQDRGVPVLLAGTLNAAPGSAELTTLTDTTTSVLPEGHPTWPADDPELQLGHLLTTEHFRVREAQVLDLELSDHRPIVTLLELVPPS